LRSHLIRGDPSNSSNGTVMIAVTTLSPQRA
jgi:hypothetical protein